MLNTNPSKTQVQAFMNSLAPEQLQALMNSLTPKQRQLFQQLQTLQPRAGCPERNQGRTSSRRKLQHCIR